MGAYIRSGDGCVGFVFFCQSCVASPLAGRPANGQAARIVHLLENRLHVLLVHQANEGNEASCRAPAHCHAAQPALTNAAAFHGLGAFLASFTTEDEDLCSDLPGFSTVPR
jgi:hypothetical protein